jgi:hypothetical protein
MNRRKWKGKQTMTDTSKATPRPWYLNKHLNSVELCGDDIEHTFIAQFSGSRALDNASLSFEAVNSYDRLRRVEKLAGELAAFTAEAQIRYESEADQQWRRELVAKARELQAAIGETNHDD